MMTVAEYLGWDVSELRPVSQNSKLNSIGRKQYLPCLQKQLQPAKVLLYEKSGLLNLEQRAVSLLGRERKMSADPKDKRRRRRRKRRKRRKKKEKEREDRKENDGNCSEH